MGPSELKQFPRNGVVAGVWAFCELKILGVGGFVGLWIYRSFEDGCETVFTPPCQWGRKYGGCPHGGVDSSQFSVLQSRNVILSYDPRGIMSVTNRDIGSPCCPATLRGFSFGEISPRCN